MGDVSTSLVRFRIGDALLELDSDDEALNNRFAEIYRECSVPVDPGEPVLVTCRIRTTGTTVDIGFDDPELLDVPRFAGACFPGQAIPVRCSADGRALSAGVTDAWRPFVANLAVSRLQRLQRHVTFFHAATAVVNGRGLMACGPKRSGKTTLGMALAARGHDLFGDELAAVRHAGPAIVPVRRSLAVREGPALPAARSALEASRPDIEIFPDGEPRQRAAIAALYPPPAQAAAPLTTLLLLRSFAATPVATPVETPGAVMKALTPLAASLWERTPGAMTMQLLRLLSGARAWWIDAGPVENTVELVERLMEST